MCCRGVCWRWPRRAPISADLDVVDADPGVADQSEDEEEDSSGDAHPLLFLYDCETTGFSIYNEHITDMIIASPVPLTTPTFCSLVKTSRRIPAAGTSNNPAPCTP